MFQVDVALGLYNGGKYLPEFLSSLQVQTLQDWRLVVRDDGSSDDSLDIVKRWAAEYGHPLKIVDDTLGNLGVVSNFSVCLNYTDAPFVSLADQDDVWFPTKLEDALTEIQQLEHRHGKETPLAVYCDLQVVDAQLRELHPSFLAMQGQGQRRLPTVPQLLAQNVAPGCSMMVNRALLSAALPIPAQASMHDWWMLLLALTLGHVGHLTQPGLAYRQHGGNQVGAKHGGVLALLVQAVNGRGSYLRRLDQSRQQALALAKRLPADSPFQPTLELYGTLGQHPPVYRQIRAWRAGFSKVGHIRNLAFYLLM